VALTICSGRPNARAAPAIFSMIACVFCDSARARAGPSSLLRPRLPLNDPSVTTKPVAFPPGCGKLATKPLPTGSAIIAKTMGMVRVCCNGAVVVGVVFERMRSGSSATSSFANRAVENLLRRGISPVRKLFGTQQEDAFGLERWRKKRTISRLASGPRGSVYDPAALPPDHAWPAPCRTQCSRTARPFLSA
jgi:hypothetical protein